MIYKSNKDLFLLTCLVFLANVLRISLTLMQIENAWDE